MDNPIFDNYLNLIDALSKVGIPAVMDVGTEGGMELFFPILNLSTRKLDTCVISYDKADNGFYSYILPQKSKNNT